MNSKLMIVSVLSASIVSVQAATRYVVPPGAGATPGGGYTSWLTAATNLQDAVAATSAGDTVLVSNGTYFLENQITVTNIAIRSFKNGVIDRDGTIIDANNYAGKPVTNRCFTLSHTNALVEGFTITNGYVVATSGGGVSITAGTLKDCLVTGNIATNGSGGGVYASGANSRITNCTITANLALIVGSANNGGGGVKLSSAATLANSRILYNNSPYYWSAGGGINADGASLVVNCMIVSNKVGADYNLGGSGTQNNGWWPGAGYGWSGGGVWAHNPNAVTLRNCLIAGNGRGNGDRGTGLGSHGGGATIENCTIIDNIGSGIGAGNPSTYKLLNTISYYNTGADLAASGGALNASNSCASSLAAVTSGSGNITTPPAFVDRFGKNYRLWPWSAGVDAGLWQSWMTNAADLDDQPRLSGNGLVDMGAYETTAGSPPNQYVARNGQIPVSPYTNGWASAASNLHAVMAVAFDGGMILVSNGVYTLTNQVVVGNLKIKSYKSGGLDRDGVIIDGGYPGTTNRCFTLANAGALLEGLTISNGYGVGVASTYIGGGGVYLTAGTVRDCVITGNIATNGSGGGVYATGAESLVTNCDLIANTAFAGSPGYGGGGIKLASGASVWNSRILYNNSPQYWSAGGGVHCGGGTLVASCHVISNRTGSTYTSGSSATHSWGGGGIWADAGVSTQRNCLIMGNGRGQEDRGSGIGAWGGGAVIENCTIVSNWGSGIGGGTAVNNYRVINTISYFNGGAAMYAGSNVVAGTLIVSNSCATDTNYVTAGSGNITNDPRFANAAAGNYRLRGGSPCINTGLNQDWMIGAVDLDGGIRIAPLIAGTVDMGAYEYPNRAGSIFTVK